MSDAEKVLRRAGLVFPRRGDEVLLSIKTGKIGKGCRNGYGGGIDGDETPEESMARELYEESLLWASAADVERAAVVDFHNETEAGEAFTCRVYVGILWKWLGTPTATREMAAPQWHPIKDLPLQQLMPADRDWLPHVLAGQCLYAEAWYAPRQKYVRQPTRMMSITPMALNLLWL